MLATIALALCPQAALESLPFDEIHLSYGYSWGDTDFATRDPWPAHADEQANAIMIGVTKYVGRRLSYDRELRAIIRDLNLYRPYHGFSNGDKLDKIGRDEPAAIDPEQKQNKAQTNTEQAWLDRHIEKLAAAAATILLATAGWINRKRIPWPKKQTRS